MNQINDVCNAWSALAVVIMRQKLALLRLKERLINRQIAIREATKHQLIERIELWKEGRYRFNCHGGSEVNRVAIDTSTDTRKGDTFDPILHGDFQRTRIAGGQQLRLAIVTAI